MRGTSRRRLAAAGGSAILGACALCVVLRERMVGAPPAVTLAEAHAPERETPKADATPLDLTPTTCSPNFERDGTHFFVNDFGRTLSLDVLAERGGGFLPPEEC